ncbi:MAG: MltA domain-containing protein [Cohaesibacteraceae bacterium]|nr:MltA domain-containing protein [Cohaesibacteraceae bacterium]MBL4875945.1 MltA domain-containing protein [Cohaesibacteraceae bacterium]
MLKQVPISSLDDWQDEDFKAAFAAFSLSVSKLATMTPDKRDLNFDPLSLHPVLAAYARIENNPGPDNCRSFFEDNFTVWTNSQAGHVTGYYQPEFKISRKRNARYKIPLLAKPRLLKKFKPGTYKQFPDTFEWGLQNGNKMSHCPNRKSIEQGNIPDHTEILAWFENRVDLYTVHIQGSALLQCIDGADMSVSFDGKSGHPYTSIGKILVERGIFTNKSITMALVCLWLEEHPGEGEELMQLNQSYIFFKQNKLETVGATGGPVSASGACLSPMRSIAIDRFIHIFGLPVWLSTSIPGHDKFNRLMIAQDTGSAITGLNRADIFTGTGEVAGELAGRINDLANFSFFLPRDAKPIMQHKKDPFDVQ